MTMRSRHIFSTVLAAGLVWGGVTYSASSWLVSNSPTGLVYSGYANQGQTNAVNTIPDFSKAGYKGGGVPIPFVPAAVTVTNGPGDDTARIQTAINNVSALPVGTNGFRGAVLLAAGEYTVGSTLTVSTSGVVIRGAGSQESGGTRITYTATTQSNLFEVDSGTGGPTEVGGTRVDITDSFLPVGTRTLTLSSASVFSPGDPIIVQMTVNQKWLDDLSNMSQWGWSIDGYQLTWRRVITAVNGNQITLDAPIVQTIEDQYGGGDIYKYTYAGELENVGFECLRLESTYVSETDENHGWIAIRMDRLQNGWVRQVTGRYFGYGLVKVDGNSQQVTVEDCAMLDPKSIITGGRRYSFNMDDSQYLLFQRCLARDGRHDFVSGSKTPGPNVFVDCRADNTHADAGPHHRYATGQIYDNVMAGQINVQNRESSGSGHGWAGAQILFWNCDAGSIICDAPNGAMNWCIGSTATQAEGSWAPEEPPGIWDSHNVPVTPRSLYYTQLTERLGTNALNNIILPQQKSGGIWTGLHNWDGDGLFGDELLVLADPESTPAVGVPLSVRGVIRNLPMLDRGVTCSWSRVYGPAPVTFANNAGQETSATFSQNGAYVLEFAVDDGISNAKNTVTIQVGDGNPDTTPPAAPTNVVASADDTSIRITWDANTETDLAGYDLYRSTVAASIGGPLGFGLTSTNYVDTSVEKGVPYYYTVYAVDTNINVSAPSVEAMASINLPPTVEFADPMDGQVFNEGDDIYVLVNASDTGGLIVNVKLYLSEQYIRQENSAPYEWAAEGQLNNDPQLRNMDVGTYTLKAVAVDDQGALATNSISVTVEVDVTPPAAPTGLAATAGDGEVSLDWDDNGEGDFASYSVYRSTTSSNYSTALVTGLSSSDYTDSTAVNDTSYYYVVTAWDTNSNESAQSAEVSATPQEATGFSDVTIFGSDNDGLGGFTQTVGFSNVIWTTETNSVKYRNQDTGTQNSSLLKAFALDRSNGTSYTVEGEFVWTDGYADDNNRVGMYLFGKNNPVVNEDEATAVGLIWNVDAPGGGNNPDDEITLRGGIDYEIAKNTPLVYSADINRNTNSYDIPTEALGTQFKFAADLVFTNIGGTNLIFITASLTDDQNNVTTIPEVRLDADATDYSGDLFGFLTRARSRNYGVEGDARSAPWVMDYKSFSVVSGAPALEGYAKWLSDNGVADTAANFYEYAMASDPTDGLAPTNGPLFTKAGDGFLYVHPQRSDDTMLTYTVETTTNLLDAGSWTNLGVVAIGTNVTGETLNFVTNDVDVTDPEKFIRLKIER